LKDKGLLRRIGEKRIEMNVDLQSLAEVWKIMEKV
jgi:hypothetical protein